MKPKGYHGFSAFSHKLVADETPLPAAASNNLPRRISDGHAGERDTFSPQKSEFESLCQIAGAVYTIKRNANYSITLRELG